MPRGKTPAHREKSATKEWTIMVYMAGDNNLSEDMITGLVGMKNAMAAPDSGRHINLIAVYDSGYPSVATTYYEFTEANSGKPLADSAKGTPKKGGEKNRIADFVKWAASGYKAKNYALILSGHSDGIIGRTMFHDSNPDKALNVASLDSILEKSVKQLGGGKKFALLGFDSCLMNMIEVGYELKGHADVIVASEGNIPTSGWNYEAILETAIREVTSDGKMTGKDLALSIVKEFQKFSSEYNIGGRSVNISACETSEFKNVGAAVNGLAKTLNGVFRASIKLPAKPTAAQLKTARSNALVKEKIKQLIHRSHYHSQTFMYEQSVDIVDLVDALASNSEISLTELEILCGSKPNTTEAISLRKVFTAIQADCGKVKKAVESCVFAHGMCGASFQFSTGLSLFFPWTVLAFFMLLDKYKRLKFSKDHDEWIKFVGTYTELTYRPRTTADLENKGYLDRINAVEDRQTKDVSFKDVSFKDHPAKDVSFKDVSFKDVSFKDVSFRDVSFRDVSFRDVSFRDVSFRNVAPGGGGESDFYSFFRRFRNHPIDHNVSDIIIR